MTSTELIGWGWRNRGKAEKESFTTLDDALKQKSRVEEGGFLALHDKMGEGNYVIYDFSKFGKKGTLETKLLGVV